MSRHTVMDVERHQQEQKDPPVGLPPDRGVGASKLGATMQYNGTSSQDDAAERQVEVARHLADPEATPAELAWARRWGGAAESAAAAEVTL